jgi:phosphopantothenoylcysteine decarboxylase/phosphopantothenate--cysteine ligase
VRFIGNRSSGKQGLEIALALHMAGADVTLVCGQAHLDIPATIKTVHVETAAQMLQACESALPADVAVCAAAVSDWAPAKVSNHKIKKRDNNDAPSFPMKQNPDILKTIAGHKKRPRLVIGFAAETENLLENAKAKLNHKGCDWILANDVGNPDENVFGSDENHIYLVSHKNAQINIDDWGRTTKKTVATRLVTQIAKHFAS